jgi:hypothetical protein
VVAGILTSSWGGIFGKRFDGEQSLRESSTMRARTPSTCPDEVHRPHTEVAVSTPSQAHHGGSPFSHRRAQSQKNPDGSGDRSELHFGYPAPAATTRPPRATNGGEATAATPTPTANPELPSQQSGSQIIQLSGTGTNRQVYRGRESAVRRITDPTQAARWLSRIPGITENW